MSVKDNSYGCLLGLEHGEVRLTQFRREWLGFYHKEITDIQSSLSGNVEISAEHIGSTAIPGIVAKPIVDIMIGVKSRFDFPLISHVLTQRGYLPKGELNRIPNCEFFTFGSPCIFHVHLTIFGSDFWKKQIRFREFIKQDHSIAGDYVRLKTELANRYPKDRAAYTEGKTEFVEEILAKAFQRDI